MVDVIIQDALIISLLILSGRINYQVNLSRISRISGYLKVKTPIGEGWDQLV